MKEKIIIESLTRGSCRVVKVKGFMDMTQVPHFEKFLDDLIQANLVKIVLDFTELEYISSAGLGAIIGRIREVRKRNGDIKIGGCTPPVMEILKVFGFSEVFSLSVSPENALKLFKE